MFSLKNSWKIWTILRVARAIFRAAVNSPFVSGKWLCTRGAPGDDSTAVSGKRSLVQGVWRFFLTANISTNRVESRASFSNLSVRYLHKCAASHLYASPRKNSQKQDISSSSHESMHSGVLGLSGFYHFSWVCPIWSYHGNFIYIAQLLLF